MLFGVKKQALLILHERASRLTLAQRPEDKSAEATARAMVAVGLAIGSHVRLQIGPVRRANSPYSPSTLASR